MPTLLVTGFGPWADHAENASSLWWQRAQVSPPNGWSIRFEQLPVDWRAAPAQLDALLNETPELGAVALCGLAADRCAITPERFAHNIASTSAPDILGACHPTGMIEPRGPVAYASTLPVERLVHALGSVGIPASESRDAGTYLCNAVLYQLLHWSATRAPDLWAGFIHVPARSSLTEAQWQQAAEIVLATLTTDTAHPSES